MTEPSALPPYLAERLYARERIELAATDSAVGMARLFIKDTLTRWGLSQLHDDARLVASELVTNAVKATGVTGGHPAYGRIGYLNLIHIHLLALDASVVVEVWDVSKDQPVPAAQLSPEDTENGRGLFLVEALCSRWGSSLAGTGKVVWAELMLPLRHPPRRAEPRRSNVPPAVLPDAELLQRVLVGLGRL